VELPVFARRSIYRIGYRALQLRWALTRPHMQGVKCVITHADGVLLVRHTYGSRSWDIPGGGLKPGEDPAGCARREMAEELGLDIDQWTPIGELCETMHSRRDRLHCFHADLDSTAVTIDRGEIAEAGWFPRGSLPLDLAPHVIPILARTVVQRRA
jgi:8-oxo-dGTP pyrophosphatase MutT (NUDIX family)